MMNDLDWLFDVLLPIALLVISLAFLLWLARGFESLAGGPAGMRFEAPSPRVREEIDPPRWRIERIGQDTATSGRSTQALVERRVFHGDQLTVRRSSDQASPEAGSQSEAGIHP